MNSVLDSYFDETTMSVHFKPGVPVFQKKGLPGQWEKAVAAKKNLSVAAAEELVQKLLTEAEQLPDSFIEIDKRFSKVLQVGHYRIVIVLPPLSDTIEITVARPLKKLGMSDYRISERLITRLKHSSEGVLIAGRPGQGKSTFAQALIELYAEEQKIIKTVEAPRDLQVPDDVTQYSLFHSTLTEIHDILLLSRPDYTFFDEVRNREDFELFKDLRLTGIGMVGVIHGAKPIDAIQRFVGKIELGMIPEVVDTLIFIEAGKIYKVYELALTVKVPHGMQEQDLARPVVVIRDFETQETEYEIYTFGSETVVLPLLGNSQKTFRSSEPRSFKRASRSVDVSSYGAEIFPRMFRDKKGVRFLFDTDVSDAILLFEDGHTFSLSPNRRGYVKIGKQGKLPDLLRKQSFRVFRAVEVE